MRRFIKTIIPTENYQEITKIGERYIVHLDNKVDGEDNLVQCYECIVDTTPDLVELAEELEQYKNYLRKTELDIAKMEKCKALKEYDSSENVDSFTIGGQVMWLTVEERQQIATQISANESIGRDTMTRWFNGQAYTFPINTWKQMLAALEVYAGDALNVTESHKAAINALETIQEVEEYDFTLNYPPKLIF